MFNKCNICGREDLKLLFAVTDYISGRSFSLFRCPACGSGSTYPQLPREELEVFYSVESYDDNKTRVPFLANYFKSLHPWIRIRKILPYFSGKTGRMLDIGCGRGWQLKYFRDRGWEVWGTELSGRASAFAREQLGLNIIIEDIKNFHFEKEYFDVVSLWHVLEHLTDPKETMQEVERITKNEGLLFISLPNFSSWQARIFNKNWFLIEMPKHLYHFTPASLEGILGITGFGVVEQSTFSLEYGLFSAVQSSLNVLGLEFNFLWDFLTHKTGRLERLGKIRFFANLSLTILLAPACFIFGVIFEFLSVFFSSGAVLTVVAKKQHASNKYPEIAKTEEVSDYSQIEADFYDQQLRSHNPLRVWLHTNRYLLIDLLVKASYVRGEKIVDLGCANCNWNGSLLPVHGVDINEGMLKLAYAKKRLASYEVNDFRKTSVATGEADIVVASEVMEHLEDADAFLKEIKRMLRPAGKFIFSVPYDTPLSLFRPLFFLQCLFHGYILNDKYYRNHCGHLRHFALGSLRDLLSANGFAVDDLFEMRRFLIFGVAHKERRRDASRRYDDLTIVIPAFSEEEGIKRILPAVLKAYPAAKIIVCDSGFREKAGEALESYAARDVLFLDRPKEGAGVTGAVLAGINSVETPYFVVVAGDLRYPIHKISEIYNVLKTNYDMVVASRVRVKGWHFNRAMISFIATVLGKIILSLRSRAKFSYDILSGFWGGDTFFIRRVARENRNKFQRQGEKILFDFLKVIPKNARIGEVFYEFDVSGGREAKIKPATVVVYLKSLFT